MKIKVKVPQPYIETEIEIELPAYRRHVSVDFFSKIESKTDLFVRAIMVTNTTIERAQYSTEYLFSTDWKESTEAEFLEAADKVYQAITDVYNDLKA